MRPIHGHYYEKLDHLRALAVYLVFIWHFTQPYLGRDAIPPDSLFFLSLPLQGHVGVSLFMTLSGYLYCKLLLDRDIAYGPFIWNRLLRLLPLLAFAFSLHLFLDLLRGGTFGMTVLPIMRDGVLPSLPHGAWSIEVEFHYYLLLPLLLLLLRRSLPAVLLLLSATFALRIFLLSQGQDLQSFAYFSLVGRLDQFVLGVLACRLAGHLRRPPWLLAAATAAFLFAYHLFNLQGGSTELGREPLGNMSGSSCRLLRGSSLLF